MNQIKETTVDKEQFHQELKKYHDTDVFSEELGTIILQMISGQLFSYKFRHYGGYWHDEMYTEALERCMGVILNKKFDFSTCHNVFGYFYAIVINSFLTALKRLHRKLQAQEEYQDIVYCQLMRDHPDVFVYIAPVLEENFDEY